MDLPGKSTFTVYHGQRMHKSELESLKANIGHLVSTNAFFSTTLDSDVAGIFSGRDVRHDIRESVIFKIEVDTCLRHSIFARIDNDRLSYTPEEGEVLFNLSTVFKVINVYEEQKNSRWVVHLEATDEGHDRLQEYKLLSQSDVETKNVEIDFGRLLMNMGHYRKAITYFASLDKRLDVYDTSSRAIIASFHSACLYLLGQYDEAQVYLENTLSLLDKMRMYKTDILYLRCKWRLANVHVFKENLNVARTLYEETLSGQEISLPPTHLHIAETIQGLGWLYAKENSYDKSLPYIEKASHILEQLLPENHPKRIRILFSLAGAYECLGRFQLALEYLNKTLEAQKQYYPCTHPIIAETLREIGAQNEVIGDWDAALDFYFRALEIWTNTFPAGHLLVVNCLNVIGSVYRKRKEFSTALDYQIRACEMRKTLPPRNTPFSQHGLANTYLDMGDNEKRLSFSQKRVNFVGE